MDDDPNAPAAPIQGPRPAGEGPHERIAVPHVMRHVMKPERS
jgi:hypothetical protein